MEDDLIRLGLVDEEDIALDEAALLLAALDHPGTDLEPYGILLDTIAARLEAIGGEAESPVDQAAALSDVLGGDFGLAGDRETYDDPANADLIRVLDRRRGLPVALSILWVAAARRMGWEAEVLDVPGHVLVLIGTVSDPFIVDPFAGGARVDAERLTALVEAHAPGQKVTSVSAMPNRAILVRLLRNQAMRAERSGEGARALELFRRMTVMAPAAAHAWWERARLELAAGDVPAARASLGAILEVTRDPAFRERVSETLEQLPAG